MGKEEGGRRVEFYGRRPTQGLCKDSGKNQPSESIGPGGTICQVAGMCLHGEGVRGSWQWEGCYGLGGGLVRIPNIWGFLTAFWILDCWRDSGELRGYPKNSGVHVWGEEKF